MIRLHLSSLFLTLGELTRQPLRTAIHIIMISGAFTSPLLFYIGINSVAQLVKDWQGQPQLTVFLQREIDPDAEQRMYQSLQSMPAIQELLIITPAQALAELREYSGLSEQIDLLDNNPLPTTFVVIPTPQNRDAQSLRSLRDHLLALEGIDMISLDLEWIERLNGILKLLTQVGTLFNLLLMLGVTFAIANVIHLHALGKQDEIEITRLVGGTDAFIRRPFLYYGFTIGFFSGLVSVVLVTLLVKWYLAQPLHLLADLFQRQSLVYSLTAGDMVCVPVLGAFTGWLAARLSLMYYLRQVSESG